jgi:hypothetical protein
MFDVLASLGNVFTRRLANSGGGYRDLLFFPRASVLCIRYYGSTSNGSPSPFSSCLTCSPFGTGSHKKFASFCVRRCLNPLTLWLPISQSVRTLTLEYRLHRRIPITMMEVMASSPSISRINLLTPLRRCRLICQFCP